MTNSTPWADFVAVLQDRVKNKGACDDALVQPAVDSLAEGQIAHGFALAGLLGELAMLKALAIRLKGDLVELQDVGGVLTVARVAIIDGQPFPMAPVEIDVDLIDDQILDAFHSQVSLKDILLTIRASTGEDFCQPSAWTRQILRHDNAYWNQFSQSRRLDGWPGTKPPHLTAEGVLQQPELAIALLLSKQEEGIPESWFRDMICLADPAMISIYPDDLVPFTTQCRIANRKAAGCEAGELSQEEALALPEEELDARLRHGSVNFQLRRADGSINPTDAALIYQYLPRNAVLHDTAVINNGQVYCRTTPEFLLRFPHVANQETLTASVETLKDTVPVHVLRGYSFTEGLYKPAEQVVGVYQISRECQRSGFIHRAVMKHLHPELKNRIATHLKTRDAGGVDFETYLGLMKAFGVKPGEVAILVDPHPSDLEGIIASPQQLHAGGMINFTRQPADDAEREMMDVLLEICPADILIGGVPKGIEVERLTSFLTSEKQYSDRQLAALYLLMRQHPIQFFVERCTAPEHWERLHEGFGTDAMEPYITRAPESVQTGMALDTLGL